MTSVENSVEKCTKDVAGAADSYTFENIGQKNGKVAAAELNHGNQAFSKNGGSKVAFPIGRFQKIAGSEADQV